MVDLYNHINDLEQWKTGKGVVLSGVGGTFCSGGDLETIFKLDKNHAEAMCMFMHTITTRLFNLPLVSVAAIDGHALGGGAELVTACDFRVAASKAKIGFVQAKLNVSPGWGGGTRLVKLIGRTYALHLLISGSVIDANKALEYGLVNEIVTNDGAIFKHGQQWLVKHLAGNVDSIKALKTVVAKASDSDIESSLITERKQFLQVWGTQSHAEAREKKLKHKWATPFENLSFEVCDHVRLKPACSATEASWSLEIFGLASIDIILFRQRTTKVLIRLRRCAGWSAPLLFAYGINRFSHDVAEMSSLSFKVCD